jgi:uncharacterized protein (TIGR00290 family)
VTSRHARVVVSWSGGKDSALALDATWRDRDIDVVALLTTVTAAHDRISMHGVRTELLRAQCRSLGLPLREVQLVSPVSNETYEAAMRGALDAFIANGVSGVVFGDLFLADIREYRERQCATAGLRCHFPLWLHDTRALAESFIERGFRAILVCVDPRQLDPAYCGREFDAALLASLPATVDPCGENGEFHTFVYDGPIFSSPVPVARGVRVERSGFWFCDLTLGGPGTENHGGPPASDPASDSSADPTAGS